MDLNVSSIDKNMTITVQLIDTAANNSVVTDTFSAAGAKQYKIDQSKYKLEVSIDKANGNSKYAIDLLMPETGVIEFFDEDEVPLSGLLQITLKDLEAEVPLSDLPISASDTITYVVAAGDSLWRIAQKQYGDSTRWHEIYDMNKDVIGSNPNRIYAGQVLTIKVK